MDEMEQLFRLGALMAALICPMRIENACVAIRWPGFCSSKQIMDRRLRLHFPPLPPHRLKLGFYHPRQPPLMDLPGHAPYPDHLPRDPSIPTTRNLLFHSTRISTERCQDLTHVVFLISVPPFHVSIGFAAVTRCCLWHCQNPDTVLF